MNNVLTLVFITLIPALELRASIPYGIWKLGMNWIEVFLIVVIANIVLGILIYPFIEAIINFANRIKIIEKLYNKYIERTQKKIHHYVEKYGEIGMALFIAIPLPGSGVYSGALGAYLIGLEYKRFIIAAMIGVLIAAGIVTFLSLSGRMFGF